MREPLRLWLKEREERAKRFLGHSEPTVFLNAKGKRPGARAIGLVIRHIPTDPPLELSAHILRHTCLTKLVRRGYGNDLVLVVEIAGHKRLETTPRYSLPCVEDCEPAMTNLQVDYYKRPK